MTGRLLTVAEVAERLAVSEKAVRAAIARGDLPATKVCGRVRVGPHALDAYVDAGRIQPQRAAPRPVDLRRPSRDSLRAALFPTKEKHP